MSVVLLQQQQDGQRTARPVGWWFTARQIADALGSPLGNVEHYLPFIIAASDEFGLTSRECAIALLATIGVETGAFVPIREYRNPDGSIPDYWWGYDGGPPYSGRGFIQLTHAYNYKHYGDLLRVDLLNNPDLALDPEIAARVLAAYFSQRDICSMAQAGDWRATRRAVNGGYAGWDRYIQIIRELGG